MKKRKRPLRLLRPRLDTGDYVKYLPTKEKFIVACVIGDKLSWLGFEEGSVKASECRLLKRASPKQKLKVLQHLTGMENQNDHRAKYAKAQLSNNKKWDYVLPVAQ